jgi:hypothetical protein
MSLLVEVRYCNHGRGPGLRFLKDSERPGTAVLKHETLTIVWTKYRSEQTYSDMRAKDVHSNVLQEPSVVSSKSVLVRLGAATVTVEWSSCCVAM